MRVDEVLGRIITKLNDKGEELVRKTVGDELYNDLSKAAQEVVNFVRDGIRRDAFKVIKRSGRENELSPEERKLYDEWLRRIEANKVVQQKRDAQKLKENPVSSAVKYIVKRVKSKTADADSMKNPVYVIYDETGKTVGHAVRQGNLSAFKIDGHPTVKVRRPNIQQAVDDWANNVVDQPTKTLKPSKSIVDLYKSNKN